MQFRMIDGSRNAERLVQILLYFERVLDRRGVDDAGAFEASSPVKSALRILSLSASLSALRTS